MELRQLDTRYERLRLRDKVREYALQTSIMEQGIVEPLCAVELGNAERVLLDGYKRYRSAVRLQIKSVPVTLWDGDAAVGLLKLLRFSSGSRMTAIEEAGLVDELHRVHLLSAVEIASRLERSAAWVSLRLGLIHGLRDDVRESLFSGRFPVRSYLYSLRRFTRVKNGARHEAVSAFVRCVAGHGLSGRDIDRLAFAYFRGSPVMRAQIESGHLEWTLRQLKEQAVPEGPPDGLSEPERLLLSRLKALRVCMGQLETGLPVVRTIGREFAVRGRAASGQVLRAWDTFHPLLREFHENAGEKTGGVRAAQNGKAE
jgi:hypothetical protein